MRQPVSPALGWYVPSGHGKHEYWLAFGWKVPGKHLIGGDVLPVQKWPSEQGVQLDSSTKLWLAVEDASGAVPGGHGVGIALPTGQYVPMTHGIGFTVAAGQYEPAGQRPEHCGPDCTAGSIESPKRPGAQGSAQGEERANR